MGDSEGILIALGFWGIRVWESVMGFGDLIVLHLWKWRERERVCL